jgi:hypothetical protein
MDGGGQHFACSPAPTQLHLGKGDALGDGDEDVDGVTPGARRLLELNAEENAIESAKNKE